MERPPEHCANEIEEDYKELLKELDDTGLKIMTDINFVIDIEYTGNVSFNMSEPEVKRESVVYKDKKKKTKSKQLL